MKSLSLVCLLSLQQLYLSSSFSTVSTRQHVSLKTSSRLYATNTNPRSIINQRQALLGKKPLRVLFSKNPPNNSQQQQEDQELQLSFQEGTLSKNEDCSSPEPSSSSLPTFKQLTIFVATTILIWLSEPLLSLVDTTIVGMTCNPQSAVLQIAALGPATTLYDSLIYLTYFLAMAATNQVAPALAKKKWKQLRQSTSHVMGLALLFGFLVTAICFGTGKHFITSMVGDLASSEIIPLATKYAWIRASVAPFCVVGFVAQSVCLACLDTRTPAIAVVVASIVNIIGDLALSPRWGIQGAAIATALATVSSCLVLVRKVRKTTGEWKVLQEQEEALERTTSTRVVNGTVELIPKALPLESATNSTEMDTASTEKDIPFYSLPSNKSLVDLLKLGGPIFFVMLSKIACYSLMTVRATTFGIVPLASHNIMMRVFFFYSCFGDSLSQAAQSFFPSVAKKEQNQLLRQLLYIATWIGVWNCQIAKVILQHFGRYLIQDASIIQTMAAHTQYLGLALLIHPFIMVFEGIVLAKRDLVFLIVTYALTMALHFGFVFSPMTTTFNGLWRALAVFQSVRLAQFGARTWKMSRSENKAKLAVS
jgi:Na+-driven multidrug efflux pump